MQMDELVVFNLTACSLVEVVMIYHMDLLILFVCRVHRHQLA